MKGKLVYCLVWGLIAGVSLELTAQPEEALVSARIELLPNGDLSSIRGFCDNHTTAPLYLNYRLSLRLKGPNGVINDQQSGDFDLTAGTSMFLGAMQVTLHPEDQLRVDLEVFTGVIRVAVDSLVVEPMNSEKGPKPEALVATEALIDKADRLPQELKESPVDQSEPKPDQLRSSALNLEIDGLVIDDTRTKIGYDFYDLFFNKWIPPDGVSDFIITVKELPNIGRSSRVALLVNEDEVLQRILSPRYDLIESQVNLSIRVLRKYLADRQSVSEQLGNEDQRGSGIF